MKLNTTFDLRTQMQRLVIQSFKVNNTGIPHTVPTDANPFLMGEWFTFDSDGKVNRSANNKPAYVSIAETASPDVEVTKRVPLIIGGTFVGWTKLYDGDIAPNDALEVAQFTYGSGTVAGVKKADLAADSGIHYIVGYALNSVSASATPRTDHLEFVGVTPFMINV